MLLVFFKRWKRILVMLLVNYDRLRLFRGEDPSSYVELSFYFRFPPHFVYSNNKMVNSLLACCIFIYATDLSDCDYQAILVKSWSRWGSIRTGQEVGTNGFICITPC